MTDLDDEATSAVRRFVLRKYHEEHAGIWENHLTGCKDADVKLLDARDGSYGCETGCDYVRFEAEITCGHGEAEVYEYGQFGTMDLILADIFAFEHPTPPEPEPRDADGNPYAGSVECPLCHRQVYYTAENLMNSLIRVSGESTVTQIDNTVIEDHIRQVEHVGLRTLVMPTPDDLRAQGYVLISEWMNSWGLRAA